MSGLVPSDDEDEEYDRVVREAMAQSRDTRGESSDAPLKRPRSDSPAAGSEASEATEPAWPTECVPCAVQDEGAGDMSILDGLAMEEAINSDADDACPFACDQPGCVAAYKRECDLTKHKTKKHGFIIPEWYVCDQPGCEVKTKNVTDLVRHKASAHGLDVVWYACDQPGCEFKAKEKGNLKKHKAHVHDIDVVWYACDQPGCEYKAKAARGLKTHKAHVHDIDVVWYACDQPGCEYKSKQASHLKTHKAYVHDIDVVWHACDHPGCEFKAKEAHQLKKHKANVHDIDVVWYACDQPGCEFKCKQSGNLKTHKASAHDIDVVWYTCDQPGCEFKAKNSGNLKTHKASAHDIDVVWYACDHPGCEFKCKQSGNLKTHKAYVHDIDVVWYACDQPGCEFKCKQLANLKVHKASAHYIDVVWYACDQPGCEYKAKRVCDLKVHKAHAHDIDVVWHACDVDPDKCKYQNKFLGGLHAHIKRMHARVYAQRKKEQEERVRRALLDAGWQEHRLAEAMPPVGFFRREKRIDFKCAKLESKTTWSNIDFVLGVPNGFVFLEVDENQHKYGYGAELSCDMKRMACVMESLAVETNYNLPRLYWLRYNPHAWRLGGALRTVLKVEREARLVAWLERFECVECLGIGYAFYDCEAVDEDGEPGTLDVLGNPEYNPQYAKVVENLMDLSLQ